MNSKNITVSLETDASNEYLKKKKYHAVVFCNGTKEGVPPIKGIDQIKHVQATDLLMNPELAGDAKKIVIVGGGAVGVETAYFLSYEKRRKVTVVEMLPHFIEGACTANRGHLIHYLEENGAELINCAKVTSFRSNCVCISRNVSAGVPDPYCTWAPVIPKNIENPLAKKIGTETYISEIPCDLVVLAMGGHPDDRAFLSALEQHVAPEIYNIGDSFHAGRVLEANRAAYSLAKEI